MGATATQPDRPDVFFSYSRADLAFVERLVAALAKREKDVWVDWDDIRKSADWRATIYAGIEYATVVVPVLSPDFAASNVCHEEIEHALLHNKRLIPILRRDVAGSELRDELRVPNWIFFRDSDRFDASVVELVDALEMDHDWLDAHARLLVRALEWERSGRDASFLLRGSDLEAAEHWSARQGAHRETATPLQGEYIAASRRAATRRLRLTLAAALLALGVAATLAAVAWTQRNTAIENAKQTRSREVAAISLSQLRVDPTLAVLLAREAARIRPTAQAEQALRSALRAYRPTLSLRGGRGLVNSTVFGGNGRLAVTGGDDGAVRVWDAGSGRLLQVLPGHAGALSAVVLAPDGGRIVAAADRALLVWSFPDGRLEHVLRAPSARGVFALAFDPSGSYLAAAGDAAVGIWSTRSWTLLHRLRAAESVGVTFSPDGKMLVTPRDRGGIQLWSVEGRLLHDLHGSHGSVSDAAFSPDGSTVAAADAFRSTVHVWSTRTGKELSSRPGPGGLVIAVTMREGAPIVATAGEGMVRVWDGNNGRLLSVLTASSGNVLNGRFSADGGRLIAADESGVARIWRLQRLPETLRAPPDEGVVKLVFDTSGRHLVGIGDIGDAVVWDVPTGRLVLTVHAAGRQILGAAVSHDGRLLATGDGDGTIEIWAIKGAARPLAVLRGHTDAVRTVAWSADDRLLVSAADDGTAKLWDVAARRSLRTFIVGGEGANDAAVSADGLRIAAAGVEGSIGVWDASTGRRIARFANPGKAGTVVWSPDGRVLAIADGFDNAVHIRAVPSGEQVSLLRDVGVLDYAAFSSDGERLETLAGDGVARVWDVGTGLSNVVARVPQSSEGTMAISPDGTELASATWERVSVVRCAVCGDLDELVRLADEMIPRTLTAGERALYLNAH